MSSQQLATDLRLNRGYIQQARDQIKEADHV